MNKQEEIRKIIHDIKEIENFLSVPFDRNKAIDIIRKHHFTDFNVTITDSILNVNVATLLVAPPESIIKYLKAIKGYLVIKLEKEKEVE